MKNKLSGYGFYVFGGDLLRDTTLRRIGTDKYDWISYTCRRGGIILYMNGIPVGFSRIKDCWPTGKSIRIHVRQCFGTAQDFDKYVMEMCANTYDDVEPGHAKFIATNLPILKK